MQCAVFRRPRAAGGFIFWSLLDVYSKLSGFHYRNPSAWIHKCWASWCKYVEALGCGSSTQHFCLSSTGGEVKDKMDCSHRCLPLPAVSTLALVALLARLASSNSHKSGAMQDRDIICIYILYLSPNSVSIGFLLCAGTLVVWWHVVVVGWVRIGVHRGCGLVGFGNSPSTCGVNIQTHMSIIRFPRGKACMAIPQDMIF